MEDSDSASLKLVKELVLQAVKIWVLIWQPRMSGHGLGASHAGKVKVKAMFVYVFLPLQYRCTKNDCGEVYDVQRCSSSIIIVFIMINGKRARAPIRRPLN